MVYLGFLEKSNEPKWGATHFDQPKVYNNSV